jgi:nitrous oxidase accessory protein NosD
MKLSILLALLASALSAQQPAAPGQILGVLGSGRYLITTTAAVNVQTGTSYTLAASDNGKIITLNNGSGITLTVPSGLGAGFTCLIVQLGAGAVTPTASSTTLHQRQSFTKTAGQYAVATLAAYVADTFVLGGDLQ